MYQIQQHSKNYAHQLRIGTPYCMVHSLIKKNNNRYKKSIRYTIDSYLIDVSPR